MLLRNTAGQVAEKFYVMRLDEMCFEYGHTLRVSFKHLEKWCATLAGWIQDFPMLVYFPHAGLYYFWVRRWVSKSPRGGDSRGYLFVQREIVAMFRYAVRVRTACQTGRVGKQKKRTPGVARPGPSRPRPLQAEDGGPLFRVVHITRVWTGR